VNAVQDHSWFDRTQSEEDIAMNETTNNSAAWVTFTYANMLGSLALTLGGLFFLPIDLWVKGYMLMGVVMVTSSTIILSKTLRDQHEGAKLHNKIEEARTEKLLVGLKG
jgi:hypothetical protein